MLRLFVYKTRFLTPELLLWFLLVLISPFSGGASLYVVGDSHVRPFKGIMGGAINHLGPITMHRVGRDGLRIVDLHAMGVREETVVVYVFGEIDVRCHIGKQRDVKGRDLDEVIQTLVENYLRTISQNRSRYQNQVPIVCSVTPPTDVTYNPEFPYWGTLSDRIEITQKLNEELRHMCKAYGVLFLDIYSHYADSQGSLHSALSDGNVHIDAQHNGFIRDSLRFALLRS